MFWKVSLQNMHGVNLQSRRHHIVWCAPQAGGPDPGPVPRHNSTRRGSANNYLSDIIPIHAGARHGCPLSPTLFNVYKDFVA